LLPSEREENKRLIEEAQEAYDAKEEGNQENVKFVVMIGRGERRKVIKIKKKSLNV